MFFYIFLLKIVESVKFKKNVEKTNFLSASVLHVEEFDMDYASWRMFTIDNIQCIHTYLNL